MRIALYLPNRVPEFTPSSAQLTWLANALAAHTLVSARSEAEFLSALGDAEAVIVWSFEAAWYQLAPKLRHVCTPSAGREHLAEDASGRATRHYGTFHGHIMAESLLGMMLFMNRRFGAALAAQADARWDREPYSGCRRLHGQTALILGYGHIAEHSAALLKGLGMRVHGVRRSADARGVDRLFTPDELPEALASADHVASFLPGIIDTERFMGAAEFAHMKPSAFFYNLGRGSTVDEAALLAALDSSRIAGAFLDVTQTEPLPADSALWHARNLYITPHASAISAEYLDLYFAEVAGLLTSL